ncbi:lytic transglycosylase domain-containing protein [Muricoccus radiodurans]|uniref:lytic transglycosylase domain-containing protein n=1 Tax=Muricoccus radiodurans TaxID=2231721 RepID=UPI003CEC97F4
MTRGEGGRGYGGSGDYGYDVSASRAAARAYRARSTRRDYRVPGPPHDPWGPHVRQAAARFQVPERWIREIMRQESGGRLYDARGLPITSPVGAMGLMQVMPETYDVLQARHGLGNDPYEPRDNILAGAAYIREMYERFGAPGFVAAYNAGPDRVDGYLSGAQILPDETINYLANVAPRLGREVPMTGPMADYAGGILPASARTDVGGFGAFRDGGVVPAADDPSSRAFEGGGLVTPGAPTGAAP